ncbi:MAG: DNA internalization-related competence protein ComEC/Rec2 [Lachnospiraceae bacterium]|nr:DNA internalization-related competence protein ComEC/Rec2 [Lachnospiraceae bacterium]
MTKRPFVILFLMVVIYALYQFYHPVPLGIDKLFDIEAHSKLEGTVTQIIPKEKTTAIYLKDVTILTIDNKQINSTDINKILLYYTDTNNLKIGNKICLTGTLQKFQEGTNPGQFNEYLYYKSNNIDYKIFGESLQIIHKKYDFLGENFRKIREKFSKVYQDILGEDAGIICAMVLGEKSAIDIDTKELYQKNGIAHILAISGLHITMIGMFLYKILKKLYLPNETVIPLAILALILYAKMTDAGISTNRAVLMLAISLFAKLLGRTYDLITAMCISGSITLLQMPLQIANSGFLLSYGAVFAIAVVYPVFRDIFLPDERERKKLQKKTSVLQLDLLFFHKKDVEEKRETARKKAARQVILKLLDGFLLSFSINLVTIPVILYFYFDLPIYSIFLNLCILPFLSLLLGMGIIAGCIGSFSISFGIFLGGSIHGILRLYEQLCNIFLQLPCSIITLGRPDKFTCMLYYGGLFIFLICYSYFQKKWVIIFCLSMLSVFYMPNPSCLTVTMLDVGQGDGILIENSTGKIFFIDGGSTSVKQLGKYRISPCLKSKGISSIDYACVTHLDQDHISGLTELMEGCDTTGNIKINHLVLPDTSLKDEAYQNMVQLAADKNIPVIYLKKGDKLMDGDLKFTCLHPYPEFITNDRNNYSTVLWMQYGNMDMLFTGDVSDEGEDAITESGLPECEVLKVAHHGSKYTSSEKFLEQVLPKYAIISAGENNRYGHPHKEALERLEEIGTKTFCTIDYGAIVLQTDGNKLKMSWFGN